MAYKDITDKISALLDEKESYYGPVYQEIGAVIGYMLKHAKSLQVNDLLAFTRIMDKLYRIINTVSIEVREDAWYDIAGYAILQLNAIQKEKEDIKNKTTTTELPNN